MSVRTKTISTLLLAAAALTLISPVSALTVRRSSGDGADVMARPYGTAPGEENQPMTGSTRDANGNRVIVNGMFTDNTYSSSTGGLSYGVSRGMTGASTNATAVGNLLNVVVSGRYNTVIVNSSQDNTGDQTVILNGGIKLD